MKKNSSKKIKPTPPLTTVNPDAAGIDVGSIEIYVCVPADRDPEFVRHFPTFTSDLGQIANWLKVCKIKTIAMESTGIYWIPLYEILVESGFEVHLVNPRDLKRPKKTDVSDCQWLQQMHSYGLLKSSFRPADQVCVLRSLIRHRSNIIRYRSSHVLHMQKSLHQMNLQLDNVISDITGATGMQIIRSIVAGNRDASSLAKFRDHRCRSTEEEIRKSLEGNYRTEHVFTLKQSLQFYDFYTQQLIACDDEIEKVYRQIAAKAPENYKLPNNCKKANKDKNSPSYDLQSHLFRSYGIDLTQVDGISSLTAQTIFSELGDDLTRFPTVKHFTRWLSLSPNNRISGKKILDRKTLRSRNRTSQALLIAANSLGHSKSPLGDYYRKMRTLHGPIKTNVICAHKLARIIYFLITRKSQFNPTLIAAQQQKQKERSVRSLINKARRHGFLLVPLPTAVT
jgi:transposase